ncbi:DUF6274 family protein [Streptomyces sp. DHE17-7]|uniref:DUF6274 family protein n=1 Tax=Streptomyces sp. DHE17-7 TaxID=2759949 RepID=UPI003FA74B8B
MLNAEVGVCENGQHETRALLRAHLAAASSSYLPAKLVHRHSCSLGAGANPPAFPTDVKEESRGTAYHEP